MRAEPDLVWDVAQPFIQTLTVNAGHLDEFGHTNNVVYVGWLQDVAWAHAQSLGFGMVSWRGDTNSITSRPRMKAMNCISQPGSQRTPVRSTCGALIRLSANAIARRSCAVALNGSVWT